MLLIEDFEPLARSLAQGLREAGYAVDTSGDGEEGLALAEANPYDAILLDIMLPKLDGLAVLWRPEHRSEQVSRRRGEPTVSDMEIPDKSVVLSGRRGTG